MKHLTLKQLLLAALCIGMTACTDSLMEHNPLPDTPHGATMLVTLPFGIASPTAAGDVNSTRSIPTTVEDKTDDSSDNYVKNVWVLQFEGTGTTAILKNTCFVDGDNIHFSTSGKDTLRNVTLLTGSDIGKTQRLLLVANVPQGRAYTWSPVGTSLSSILEVTQAIASEADTHATLDGKETLLMSDIIDSSSGTIGFLTQPVSLERSIAKLTVKLSVAENCIIDSVKIGGVPTVLPLAAAVLLGEETPTTYPTTATTVINYPYETTATVSSGDGSEEHPYTWTWYLPCNLKGTTTTTSQLDKTKDAPAGATYIAIYATNSDTGDRSIFTLYPGADLIKDYNLKSNHHYTYHFTLDGCGVEGDEKDSREQVIETVDYAKEDYSNCYMLHPNAAGGKAREYRIPIGRINDYWKDTKTDGYGKNPANGLEEGESWYAGVLWSDLAEEVMSGITVTPSGTYKDKPKKDYFTVEIPAGTPNGNFVVAVKDVSGSILWSWHLWVTDYDPDTWLATKPSVAAKKSYDVTGGKVDSYGGTMWESESGALYGKVMMDRNLGALEASTPTCTPASETSLGQLYYQFGRKDPFPASLDGTSTLMLDGTGQFPVPAAGQVTIATSVNNPTTFYTSSGDWTSDAQEPTYLWNDPSVSITSSTKSIYDPCPAGWRVPLNGAWNDFSTATTFWQDSPAGRKYNTTVFYATAGSRLNNSGDQSLIYVGVGGDYWSATPLSSANGRSLGFNKKDVSPQYNYSRANGFAVRCSQR